MDKIYTRPIPGGLLIELHGPLGLEAGEAFSRVVEATPPLRLVIDFGGAGPINSAFLGGMLWSVRAVVRSGGEVTAFGLTDHYRKVFHVMGLTNYVRICVDEASAIG